MLQDGQCLWWYGTVGVVITVGPVFPLFLHVLFIIACHRWTAHAAHWSVTRQTLTEYTTQSHLITQDKKSTTTQQTSERNTIHATMVDINVQESLVLENMFSLVINY